MNTNINKKIGIIDGMGAFAGARFLQLFLEKVIENRLPFPEILFNAISIDDFIVDDTKVEPAFQVISKRLENFNQQQVSMVVMACNTAHIMHPRLQAFSTAPFPSIIDAVSQKARQLGLERVGILASPLTIKTHLYESSLEKNGLMPIIPTEAFQKILERIIRLVIDNKITSDDKQELNKLTQLFINSNRLDAIVLGCTELPLAFDKTSFKNTTILDSLDILGDTLIDHLKC